MSRNPGIEMMRCIMMFLIVVHHCCYRGNVGGVVSGGISEMTVFCVDAFVFISGYYGVRITLNKILGFVGLGVYAVFIVGVFSGFMTGVWDFRFSLGWFGNSYLALLMLSPLINAGLERLHECGTRKLLNAWVAFSIIFVINWLSGEIVDLHVQGWIHGHSFSTICFVYVTARVIRLMGLCENIKTSYLCMLFISAASMNLLLAWLRYTTLIAGFGGYNSPFVIIMAVTSFLLFCRIKLPSVVEKGVAYCAPSMFTVYLLHDGIPNHYVRSCYTRLLSAMLQYMGVAEALLLTAIAVFALCLIIDIIRRFVLVVTKI